MLLVLIMKWISLLPKYITRFFPLPHVFAHVNIGCVKDEVKTILTLFYVPCHEYAWGN